MLVLIWPVWHKTFLTELLLIWTNFHKFDYVNSEKSGTRRIKFAQQWHCHAYYWFSRDRCKHDAVYSFRLLLYKQLVSPSEKHSLFLADSFCWIYGGKHPTTSWLDSLFQIGTIYWFHDGRVFGHQIIVKCTYVSEISNALLCSFLAEVWAQFWKNINFKINDCETGLRHFCLWNLVLVWHNVFPGQKNVLYVLFWI